MTEESKSSSRDDEALIAAVRKGCQAAEVHLTCSFPKCTCKQIPAAVHAVVSERRPNVVPLVKEFRDQRDECAEALRAIMEKMRAESGSTDPMEPFAYDASWEKLAIQADAALAKVPTYEQRLRNIAAGLGLDYDEMMAALAKLPPPNER